MTNVITPGAVRSTQASRGAFRAITGPANGLAAEVCSPDGCPAAAFGPFSARAKFAAILESLDTALA